MSGFRPNSSALSRDMTTTPAAPSEVWLELPAVTVPFAWKTGRRRANPSGVVSGRGPSSVSNVKRCSLTSPLPASRTSTASGRMPSSLSLPSSIAASARRWLR